jgi:hypothetical protein
MCYVPGSKLAGKQVIIKVRRGMDTQSVKCFVDYVVVDDKSRAVLTFKFPYMSEETYITLIHDKAKNGTEPYVLGRRESTLMLSAEYCEGIVINVWLGNDIIASGVYQVDTQRDDFVLRSVCDSGIELVQEARLSSYLDGNFDLGSRFAGD